MTSNDDLFQLATLAADVETKSASIQAAPGRRRRR
jgi:hypothetical protein